MKYFILLFFLINTAIAGTCTSISRTNFSANSILTSSDLNSQFNTVYNQTNDLDGGCITDGTLEKAALNSTDFEAFFNGIHQGCKVTQSDAATISVDRCILSMGGNFVKTTTATTVTWGCTGCASEVASSDYYVYAKDGSTGTTLDLLISTTEPNGDGFDGSGNKILGQFRNNASSDISEATLQWNVNRFSGYTVEGIAELSDTKTAATSGGSIASGWQVRTLNTKTGADFVTLESNVFELLPGTYYIEATAPAFDVNAHRIALQQDPSGTPSYVIFGQNAYATNGGSDMDNAHLMGVVTIATNTEFELEHWSATAQATIGLGNPVGDGEDEIYAKVIIMKLKN